MKQIEIKKHEQQRIYTHAIPMPHNQLKIPINRISIFVFSFLFMFEIGFGQSYDKEYIKNLKYRLLVSYIIESRDININFQLNNKLDPQKKESLLLKNSPNILSGFLFQTNNVSFLWTATTPQNKQEINKYGKQKSVISKGAIIIPNFLLNFSYIENKGFYDQNYLKHPDFEGDTVLFRRHNSSNLRWFSSDINYYYDNKKFSIGVPSYFGERQLKSRFTWGIRSSYNNILLNNRNKSFFRDSLVNQNSELNLSRLSFNSFNLALTPSLYLVSKKSLFLYFDLSFGASIGINQTNLENKRSVKTQLEIPQAKIAFGLNKDRFLVSMYYNYLNQTIKLNNLMVGTILNNYGFIIGWRINQYKYRFLNWETL